MKNFTLLLCILLLPVLAHAQEFKFAVISDFNLSERNDAPLKDLNEVINDINKQGDIDFVIALGNFTEFGDRISLEKAKGALDKLSMKYYPVSGNNETRWGASGGNDFAKVFGNERFDFEFDGYRFLGFGSGPLTRSMDGHVDVDDVFWLNQELSKKPNTPVIVATHYPLTMQNVDNWFEVTDILRHYHVKIVLSGHYQRNAKTSYDGVPAFLNKSTLRSRYDNLTSYNIYSVDNNMLTASEQKIDPNLLPIPWGSNSLLTKYNPQDERRLKRPDYRMNNDYPKVDYVWTRNIFQSIYAPPATNGHNVFFGDDNGKFYCYEGKRDNELWRYETGGRILGAAAANDRVVVFGSTDKTIYGLSVKDGSVLWQQMTDEAVIGSPTIDGSTVYIGGGDATFRALDINSGNIKWQFTELENYVECKPLVYKDKVIFGAWDGNLYALNKNDGTLAWKWSNDRQDKRLSPAGVSPVASNDKVFITTPDKYMTALNINTGDTIWQTNEHLVRESIGISEDGQRIYAKTMENNVICYSALSDTPEQIWTVDVGYGRDLAASMLTEKGGTVFGSTENGVIFGIHAKNGELLWKHKVANTFVGTVVPIDGNRCYFTTSQGTVGLLNGRKN